MAVAERTAVVVCLLTASCDGIESSPLPFAPSAPSLGPDDDRAADLARETLRDEARLVLERHCGQCHIPHLPTAVPAALAVYDLNELEWAGTMNDEQLEDLARRIGEGALFDPFDERNEGKSPPPDPSPTEQQTVRSYVRAELTHRARQFR